MRNADLRAGDCPGLEALAAYRERPEAHPGIRAHLAGCPACDAEYALLDRFERAEVDPAEAADVDFIAGRLHPVRSQAAAVGFWTKWFPSRSPMLAWGAALILLVAVGIEWNRQRVPGISPESAPGVMRAGERVEWLPGQVLSLAAVPGEMRWQPVAGAASYRVVIAEVDGEVVWESETASTDVSLANARSLFLPHKALVVKVAARRPDGQSGAWSPEIRIRVEPLK